MKRQNKTGKKLTLDNQAVRELKLTEIEKLEQSAGAASISTIGTDAFDRC